MKFIWCCYKAKRFTSKLLNQSITMWNGSVYKAQFLCLLFIESKSRLPIPEFSAYHCINVRKALLYRCNIFGFHFLRIYSDCTLEILSRLWIHFTYDRFHFSFISNWSKKNVKEGISSFKYLAMTISKLWATLCPSLNQTKPNWWQLVFLNLKLYLSL